MVAPHSPDLTDEAVFLRPPFWQEGGLIAYPLGTDAIGRDILSRLIHGARLSLLIGIAVVALSIVVGTALGLVAGFFRGVVDIAVMRAMDIVLTLPSLLLAIVVVAILGPGLMNAMLAVAVVRSAALRPPRPGGRARRDREGLRDGRARGRRRTAAADVSGRCCRTAVRR